MALEYDDDYTPQRAKRGKAGSLSLKVPATPNRQSARGQKQPPQAVIKVPGWANTSSSVKSMLEYVGRADKEREQQVALEAEDGIQREGQQEIEELSQEWQEDFSRKGKGMKAPRHAAHLVLSAKADVSNENLEKTLNAARRTVEKHFGEKGYQYALGLHQDGKNPHAHVVVKTVNAEKGKPKLRLGPAQLHEIRKTFAKELTREGLEHVATREKTKSKTRHKNLKGEKPNQLQKVKAVIANMTKEQRQFERALSRENPQYNAVLHRDQQARALETLRNQVKEDTTLSKDERLEAFNHIRSFRRKVEKKPQNHEREAKATANHYLKRIEKAQKAVGPESQKKKEKLDKDIKRFLRKDLPSFKISVESKKDILRDVWDKSRVITKELSKSNQLGRA